MKQILVLHHQNDYGVRGVRADTLEECVSRMQEENIDIDECEFFELDLNTMFDVEMVPVRKTIPVRKPKEKAGG